jgi:hypothetical protein
MSTDVGIYFQGWMHKKNDNKIIGDKWNKRWFVLYDNGMLAYYANQVLQDKKNSVSLKGSSLKVIPREQVKKKHSYCFELATKDRTFLLSCQNEIDFRSWMYWLSKGHPDAPIETVIDKVVQEAEVRNRRQSLTSRVSEAAQNFFRGRERVNSARGLKVHKEAAVQDFDLKISDHDEVGRRKSVTSFSRSLPGVRVSRPMFHCENKENEIAQPIPTMSEFALKLQEFVRENEKKMDEIIETLACNFEENELKAENST